MKSLCPSAPESSLSLVRAGMVGLLVVVLWVSPSLGETETPTTDQSGRDSDFWSDIGSDGGDGGGVWWQILSAALIVLVLGVIVMIAVKKLLPRISKGGGKRISIVETVYLGPKRTVHLLKVGTRTILVGSWADGIVKLDDVTDAFRSEYDDVAKGVQEKLSTSSCDLDGEGSKE